MVSDTATIVSLLSEYAKRNRWILTLCLAHVLLALLIGSQFPLVRDAANYGRYANYVLQSRTIPLFHPDFYWVRPVVPIGAAVSKATIGIYTGVAAISGSVSIFFTYRLVELWDDERLARLVALAMFCNPFLLLWSGQLLVGTTILAGFAATYYLYFNYRKTNSRRSLYGAFFIGGTLSLIKIYGPLALGVVCLHSLITQAREETGLINWFRTYIGPSVIGGVLSVAWIVKNYAYTGQLIPKVTNGGSRGDQFLHLNSVPPSVVELMYFATQAVGVTPPNLIAEDVGRLHPALPFVWVLLPLGIFICMVKGARQYRSNTFVRLWISSIIAVFVLLQAVGHGSNWLYRHFVVLTPLVALFLAVYYDRHKAAKRAKQLGVAILVIILMSQMVFAAVIFQQHASLGYEPVVKWTDENVDADEPIYTTRTRELAFRLPNHNFTNDKRDSTIVILNDADSTAEQRREFQRQRCVRVINRLNSTRRLDILDVNIGTLGRNWWLYRQSC